MPRNTKASESAKKTNLQKAQARNASRQAKLKAKADAILAAGAPQADDNPLLTAEGSAFTEMLGKASVEQLVATLEVGSLSAKKRSRIEATVRTRTSPPTEPAAAPQADALTTEVHAAAAEGRKRASGLNAAVQVLAEAGRPLTTGEMVDQMLAKGLWKTDGKTPSATIYSAILREMKVKGPNARFRKTERGHFELTPAAKQS